MFLRCTEALHKQLPEELFYDLPESKRKRREWGLKSSNRTYASYLNTTLNLCALRPIQNFETALGNAPKLPEGLTEQQERFYEGRMGVVPPLTYNMELVVLRCVQLLKNERYIMYHNKLLVRGFDSIIGDLSDIIHVSLIIVRIFIFELTKRN